MENIFYLPPWEAMSHIWGRIQVSMDGNFWLFFGGGWAETKTGLCYSSDSQKNCKYFLQTLSIVNNVEILAPQLVGDQSEMVV